VSLATSALREDVTLWLSGERTKVEPSKSGHRKRSLKEAEETQHFIFGGYVRHLAKDTMNALYVKIRSDVKCQCN